MLNDFMGRMTKYLDKRSRNQSQYYVESGGVYSESGGDFVGAGSLRKYVKSFTTSTTIVVTHNLGARPLFQVNFDNGDGTFESEKHILYNVVHDSINQFTITLGVAATGEVICIG